MHLNADGCNERSELSAYVEKAEYLYFTAGMTNSVDFK